MLNFLTMPNYFIQLCDKDGNTRCGSDSNYIENNCTMKRVNWVIKNTQLPKTAKFHGLTHVKISTFTNFYNENTFNQIQIRELC